MNVCWAVLEEIVIDNNLGFFASSKMSHDFFSGRQKTTLVCHETLQFLMKSPVYSTPTPSHQYQREF